MVTATRPDTALARRFFAVSFVLNRHTRASRFAGVDVISTIVTAYRLEYAGAVAPSGPRNAPGCLAAGYALVSNEAVVWRVAMHRLVATTAMANLPRVPVGLLDRVCRTVGATNVPLGRTRLPVARFATANAPSTKSKYGGPKHPKSTHHYNSLHAGFEHTSSKLNAIGGGKKRRIRPKIGLLGVPARARSRSRAARRCEAASCAASYGEPFRGPTKLEARRSSLATRLVEASEPSADPVRLAYLKARAKSFRRCS